MLTRILFAVAVFSLAAGPAPAPPPPPMKTGEEVVAIPVTAKSGVVLTINGWGRAKGRLSELLKVALPQDAKSLLEKLDAGLKDDLFDGREIKGVDPDKRIYVALENMHGLNDNSFPGTIYIPTADHQAFVDAFFKEAERKTLVKKGNGVTQITVDEETYYFVVKNGYTILATNEDRVLAYLNPYEALTAKQMGPDVASTFLAADVAIYVNTQAINEAFGDEIKQFRGLIDILANGGLAGGGFGPNMDKDQLNAFISIFKGTIQCVEDSRAFVVSLEFRPTGLALRLQSRFEKDSTIASVLATEKPTSLNTFQKLAPTFATYTAQSMGPKTSAVFRSLAKEFSVGENQEEASKAVNAFQDMLKADETLVMTTGQTLPEKSITIIQPKDAKVYVDTYLKMVQALPEGAKNTNVVIKGKPTVTAAAKVYEGFTFHKIMTVLDFEATVKDQPEGQKEITLASMKKMAKEKSTNWMGTDGKTVISIVSDDWATAEATLKAYFTPNKTAWTIDARKELPETVSYITLSDCVYAINLIGDSIGELGGVIPNMPFEMPKMEKVKGDPVYFGLSITLKPEVGQFDLFIPAKAVGLARKAMPSLFPNQ